MADLEMSDPLLQADIKKSAQIRKVKPVVFPFLFHLYQLDRSPLHSHLRIQRRSYNGNIYHVSASFDIYPDKITENTPKFFRKYIYSVIIHDPVTMKPFRMENGQWRKHLAYHPDFHTAHGSSFSTFRYKADLKPVQTRFLLLF